MSEMNNREKAFENKFVHDEKINFKIEARTAKLFGLWVAEKTGLSGDAALAYAADMINANLDEPGFRDILAKAKGDLKAKNIQISDHMLEKELNKIGEEAKKQVLTESK